MIAALPPAGERFHRALVDSDFGVTYAAVGDQVAYYRAEAELAYVDVGSRPSLTINRSWGELPHVAGVLVRGVQFGDASGTVVAPANERDWAGALRLLVGAVLESGPATVARFEAASSEAIARSGLTVRDPFRPGFAWGKGRIKPPEGGWTPFWSRVLDAGLARVPGFEGRRPTKQNTVGTSGRDGTYHNVRVDQFGALAILHVNRRRFDDAWIETTANPKSAIEAAYGEPLVWVIDPSLSVIARCNVGPLITASSRDVSVIAASMIRLYEAAEPHLRGLPVEV